MLNSFNYYWNVKTKKIFFNYSKEVKCTLYCTLYCTKRFLLNNDNLNDYNNALLRISCTMWSVLSPGEVGNPKMTVTNVHRSTRLRARTAMVSGFDVLKMHCMRIL